MNFRIPSLFTHTMLSSLDTHIRATHKGMKYPVGQCEHKVTSKSSLERHRSSVHVLLRYPCEQCEYQATVKDSLDQYKKGGNILVGNVSIKQHEKKI